MSLQSDPGVDTIDTNELTYLTSDHLLNEIQSNFSSSGVTRVNIDVSPITSQLRHLQDGLAFSLNSSAFEEHKFSVSGNVYFSSSSMPTTEDLDEVIQKSFEEKSGDMFVHALQNAEDPGLQLTRSVFVSEPDRQEREIIGNYLPPTNDNPSGEDPLVGSPLYVFGIVFGVGFLLVAMYVFKTRWKKLEVENETDEAVEPQDSEESVAVPELPRYIEVDNDNDSEKSETGLAAMATSSPQQYNPTSYYDSTHDGMATEHESQVYLDGVYPSVNGFVGGDTSQPQALSENGNGVFLSTNNDVNEREVQSTAQGFTQHEPYNIEAGSRSKNSMDSSLIYKGGKPSGSIQNSQALSENLSLFDNLKSMSETMTSCGNVDFSEMQSDNNEQGGEGGEKTPSIVNTGVHRKLGGGESDEFGCCGDVGDTPTVSTPSRVMGNQWGQKLDIDSSESQSVQTSRVSNTSK